MFSEVHAHALEMWLFQSRGQGSPTFSGTCQMVHSSDVDGATIANKTNKKKIPPFYHGNKNAALEEIY